MVSEVEIRQQQETVSHLRQWCERWRGREAVHREKAAHEEAVLKQWAAAGKAAACEGFVKNPMGDGNVSFRAVLMEFWEAYQRLEALREGLADAERMERDLAAAERKLAELAGAIPPAKP